MRLAFTVLALMFWLPNVAAADEQDWSYRVTPYVWLPTLNADLRIRTNPPVKTETSTNLLDILDFAILLNGEIRKGKWAGIGEFNYLSLSKDASTAQGLFRADATVEGVMGSGAIAYQVHKTPTSNADIMLGARFWSLDAGIDFKRLPSVSTNRSWVDPFVGVRGIYDVTENIFVGGLTDIGGFGIGSDLQWEIVGRVGYKFSETYKLAVGYRHLVVDFDDSNLLLNASMTGPFIALDIEW